MFLRDSGTLDLLESVERDEHILGESVFPLERWSKYACVIDQKKNLLFASRSKGNSTEEVLKVPLGSNTEIVDVSKRSPSGTEFQIHSHSRVFTFRALTIDDLQSWFASLKILGKVRERREIQGFEESESNSNLGQIERGIDQFPKKLNFVITSSADQPSTLNSDEERLEAFSIAEQNGRKEQTVENAENKSRINLAPPLGMARRSCGYLFILARSVSSKWRETFVVFQSGHLLEFAYPGDDTPLFVWALQDEQPKPHFLSQLESDSGRQQFVIRGRLTKVNSEKTSDQSNSSLFCTLQLCGATDDETFAWGISILSNLKFRTEELGVGGQHWDFRAPSIARKCAHSVLRPFYPSVRASILASARSAEALTLVTWSHALEKGKFKASETPLAFLILSLAESDESVCKMNKRLSIVLQRPGSSSSSRTLSRTGLHWRTQGFVTRKVSCSDFFAGSKEIHSDQTSFAAVRPGWPDTAYQASIICKHAGSFRLSVQLDGEHVFGSPFRLQVEAGRVSPCHCTASYPIKSEKGEFEVQVVRRDAFMNPCSQNRVWKTPFIVTIEGVDGQLLDVLNPNFQTCLVKFSCQSLEDVALLVTLDGSHIRGSPFKFRKEFEQTESRTIHSGYSPGVQSILQARDRSVQLSKFVLALVPKSTCAEADPIKHRHMEQLEEGLLVLPSNGIVLPEYTIRSLYDELVALEALLAPLREIAEIEIRGGEEPAAEWKRILGRWQLSSYKKLENSVGLETQYQRWKALEVALSHSTLESRDLLCGKVNRLTRLLRNLASRIRSHHSQI